jgi:uncharacterized iron-regulated membrane protein
MQMIARFRGSRWKAIVWRALIVTHRYCGIAIGLLMVMWFISGIVMMYVPYPRVAKDERVFTLLPVPWEACCRFGQDLLADEDRVLRAEVENLAGDPTVRLRRSGKRDAALDLAHGAFIRIDDDRARTIAIDAAPRIIGQAANPISVQKAEVDQWTIGRLFRDRPLFRFAFDDPRATNIYVSGTTGRVAHWTTAQQRFWNWLGTIPHWLYFLDLRTDTALWSEIVIWTSLLGTFLTAVGLYIGVAQWRSGWARSFSPYRGWFYWHHLAGLVFGVVTLTWVGSGLVSMNPWGFLEGQGGGDEQARIQGAPLSWREIRQSIEALRERKESAGVLSFVSSPLGENLYWLATQPDGRVVRLDAAGNVSPLGEAGLAEVARRIAGAVPVAEQAFVNEEDAYYLRRRERFALPAYRIILDDDERTRYYLDPTSGEVLEYVDGNRRWYRWLFGGLHRIDFMAWMRARPAWDILVLILMLGGLALSCTGLYLAVRRVRNDLRSALRLVSNRKRTGTAPDMT